MELASHRMVNEEDRRRNVSTNYKKNRIRLKNQLDCVKVDGEFKNIVIKRRPEQSQQDARVKIRQNVESLNHHCES